MKGYYVTVMVGEKLKKYLEASYNGGIIKPPKDSNLMGIIKQHLELFSSTEDIELPENECVKIELPLQNGAVYSQSSGKVYVCNTLWRNRLSETGHKRVRKFFENNFKYSFHIFMDGHITGQYSQKNEEDRIKIKEAVVEFLMQYHINLDDRLIASLTRDWWRHNDRNEHYKESPLVY